MYIGLPILGVWLFVPPKVYFSPSIEAQVADEQTGLPIEGVNVVAHWVVQGEFSGGDQVMIAEAVTDNQGAFHIEGWGPRFVPLRQSCSVMSSSQPELVLFKSSYEPKMDSNGVLPPSFAIVRSSIWDGQRITLKRIEGSPSDFGFTWLGNVNWSGCEWTRIPRMMRSLTQEAERLKHLGISNVGMPSIQELRDTARGEWCQSVEKILGEAE